MGIQQTYKENSTIINLVTISLLLIAMIAISAYATLILVGSLLFIFGLWTLVADLVKSQTRNELKKADKENRLFENAKGQEKIKTPIFNQDVKVSELKEERQKNVKYGFMFLLLPIPLIVLFALIYFYSSNNY